MQYVRNCSVGPAGLTLLYVVMDVTSSNFDIAEA